jgi:hypothetical protein
MFYTFPDSFYVLQYLSKGGGKGEPEWLVATSVDILQLAYFTPDGNSVVNGAYLIHGSDLICDNDCSMYATTCVLVMINDEWHVFETRV